MGRKEFRQTQKNLRKKLTGDQYNSLVSQANRDAINLEANKAISFYRENIFDEFYNAMKNNRISEDRAKKIVKETLDSLEVKLNNYKTEKGLE